MKNGTKNALLPNFFAELKQRHVRYFIKPGQWGSIAVLVAKVFINSPFIAKKKGESVTFSLIKIEPLHLLKLCKR